MTPDEFNRVWRELPSAERSLSTTGPKPRRPVSITLLARLLDVAPSTVSRYSSGEIVVPDDVAARMYELLHHGWRAGAYGATVAPNQQQEEDNE